MVSSALYVVLVIGPRLRRKEEEKPVYLQKGLTVEDLASFNGTLGRAAYIAYMNLILVFLIILILALWRFW